MPGNEGRIVKLPGAEHAIVDEAKIREYLLSSSHPVGRFKSTFFFSLGYSAADWDRLAADLFSHLRDNQALVTEANAYG